MSEWSILKECIEQLVGRVHSMMMTLSQGVPRDWKSANMLSIFKGESKGNLLIYRPVSLTNVVEKCEKAIKESWNTWKDTKFE